MDKKQPQKLWLMECQGHRVIGTHWNDAEYLLNLQCKIDYSRMITTKFIREAKDGEQRGVVM